MPDENSTQTWVVQASQNNQILEEQSGNGFVLDFWDWENLVEMNKSEEQDTESLDFNIEENKKEELSNSDIDFNQDDLFGETTEKNNEDTELWDMDINLEKEESRIDENDDLTVDINVDNENNSNQESISLGMNEEKNESLNIGESNDLDEKIGSNLELPNEMQLENNENDLFWETKEEDAQLPQEDVQLPQEDAQLPQEDAQLPQEDGQKIDEISLKTQENNSIDKSDFSIDMNPGSEGEILKDADDEDGGKQTESGDISMDIQDNDKDDNTNLLQESNEETNNLDVNTIQIKEDIIEENIKGNDDNTDKTKIDDFDIDFNSDNLDQNNQDVLQSDIQVAEESQNNSESNLGEEIGDNWLIKNEINQNEIIVDNNIAENNSEPILNEGFIAVSNQNSEVEQGHDFVLDDSNIEWNDSNADIKQINDGNVPYNDTLVNNTTDQNQGQTPELDSMNQSSDSIKQPDMTNLLWWQSVDFAYEEHADTIQQQQNDLGMVENYTENREVISDTTVQSPITTANVNDGQPKDIIIPEKQDVNGVNNWNIVNTQISTVSQTEETVAAGVDESEKTLSNVAVNTWELKTNIGTPNIVENPVANIPVEKSVQSIRETVSIPAETGIVKSTLSLDEILDSELQSNPQFADNSKAVPRNMPTKSSSKSKRIVTVCTRLLIFALIWCVAVLAFPSVSTERKSWDVVDSENASKIIEDPTITQENQTEISYEEVELSEEKNTSLDDENYRSDGTPILNHNAPTVEFPEDTVDAGDNQEDEIKSNPDIIEPYVYTEWESPQEDTYSMEDILSTISSFKIQAEGYKEMWESDGNAKILKYSTYIIHLCEDYSTQISNWLWTDNESFSSFQTQVLEFMWKIENNLNN